MHQVHHVRDGREETITTDSCCQSGGVEPLLLVTLQAGHDESDLVLDQRINDLADASTPDASMPANPSASKTTKRGDGVVGRRLPPSRMRPLT